MCAGRSQQLCKWPGEVNPKVPHLAGQAHSRGSGCRCGLRSGHSIRRFPFRFAIGSFRIRQVYARPIKQCAEYRCRDTLHTAWWRSHFGCGFGTHRDPARARKSGVRSSHECQRNRSFVSQGQHWVDLCGAPRRQISCECRQHHNQQHRACNG